MNAFMLSFIGVLTAGSLFVSPEEPEATLIPVEDTTPPYAASTVSFGDVSALSFQLEQLQSDIAVLADEETRAVSQQASQAYLSATIIDVMERVLKNHPFCDYVAFRDTLDDSSSGILVYGNRAEVSDNTVVFPDAFCVRYYRTYTNNRYSYNYTVQEVSDYVVAFNDYTLLYTNVLEGYPSLIPDYTDILALVLIPAGALTGFFIAKGAFS